MGDFSIIDGLTQYTQKNIQTSYILLIDKYTDKSNYKLFLYNGYYYYNNIKNKIDEVFFSTKGHVIEMDFPYPEDVMNYIQSIDDTYRHIYALERFMIKLNNETDIYLRSHELVNLYKKDSIESSLFINDADKLLFTKILNNSPEAIEASKYFAAQNLLLGG